MNVFCLLQVFGGSVQKPAGDLGPSVGQAPQRRERERERERSGPPVQKGRPKSGHVTELHWGFGRNSHHVIAAEPLAKERKEPDTADTRKGATVDKGYAPL